MNTNTSNNGSGPSVETENSLPLLTFRVDGQIYGLPVSQVIRIIEMVTITHLPNIPDILQGIINLQGKAVPVIDLRRRFNLPALAYGLHTPIILVDVNNTNQQMGLIVDMVDDVVQVPQQNMEITETFIPTQMATYVANKTSHIAGVAKVDRQMIPVLAIHALLTPTEHTELTNVLEQTGPQTMNRN